MVLTKYKIYAIFDQVYFIILSWSFLQIINVDGLI